MTPDDAWFALGLDSLPATFDDSPFDYQGADQKSKSVIIEDERWEADMSDQPIQERLFSEYPHVTYHVDSFDAAGYGTMENPEKRIPADFRDSNVITSQVASGPHRGKHTIALDLDVPAVLIPSSTGGHSHLYIDIAPADWSKIEPLLNALAEAGVIEHGYAAASINRRHTALRMPWIRKPTPVVVDPPF